MWRNVSAILKGIHFRRLWVGQRERRRARNTPLRRLLRKSKQSWSRVFSRNMDVHFMSDPPAPSAGAGVVEHRLCLVSILTDSRTRYSLSALLTFPDTQ